MWEFFTNSTTVAEVKAEFKKLAFQHHPDQGGDAETFKRMFAEYEKVLLSMDGQKSQGKGGKVHTYKYNKDLERGLANIIFDLIRLKLDADIMLMGFWVWVKGNTRDRRAEIKALATKHEGYMCKWSTDKKAWYFKPSWFKSMNREYKTFDQIAGFYGLKVFTEDDLPKEEKSRHAQVTA